jgi:uncharacterized membrane protein YqhA
MKLEDKIISIIFAIISINFLVSVVCYVFNESSLIYFCISSLLYALVLLVCIVEGILR